MLMPMVFAPLSIVSVLIIYGVGGITLPGDLNMPGVGFKFYLLKIVAFKIIKRNSSNDILRQIIAKNTCFHCFL